MSASALATASLTVASHEGDPAAGTRPVDARSADDGSTDELLAALRSLFACTRKVRSWVTDVGPMTVLDVVAEHGEARVGTLAAALHVDVSTVSRSLTALCRDGLVQWRTDERDARSHLVSCTDAGRQRLAQRRAQIASELTTRLLGWAESEVADLSRLLHRFVTDVLSDPVGTPDLQTSSTTNPKESA